MGALAVVASNSAPGGPATTTAVAFAASCYTLLAS